MTGGGPEGQEEALGDRRRPWRTGGGPGGQEE